MNKPKTNTLTESVYKLPKTRIGAAKNQNANTVKGSSKPHGADNTSSDKTQG